MKRQNSEQFYRMRNNFKSSKPKASDLQSYLSVTDLKAEVLDEPKSKVYNKWNSPLPIKTLLPFSLKKDQENLRRSNESHHEVTKSTYKVKISEKLRKRTGNLLEIRLLSTCGESETAGLHQIEFFDENSRQIQIPESSSSVKHAESFSEVSSLFKKPSLKTETSWQARFLPSKPICLRVLFPLNQNVCGIRIWNLPKASDFSNSVKNAEILLNREKVWKGELKRGESSTEIALLAGFKFNDWTQKIIQTLSSSVRVVNKPQGSPNPLNGFFRKYSKSSLKLEPELSLKSRPLALEDLADSCRETHSEKNSKVKQKSDQKTQEYQNSKKSLNFEENLKNSQLQETSKDQTIKELKNSKNSENSKISLKARIVTLELLSNWGDSQYIGIFGVEMWDEEGEAIIISSSSQVTGQPIGLSVAPEYADDIRTCEKIVDGNYWTCDDSHSWLAPYSPSKPCQVSIDLLEPRSVSCLRIWNYNKSRTHSSRGVRTLRIWLDDSRVFEGEIAKAPGTLKTAEQFCEYIVLTSNLETLEKICRKDWVDSFKAEDTEFEVPLVERPGTASKFEDLSRPCTSVLKSPKKRREKGRVLGKVIKIIILDTWGDAFYAGLTGIAVNGMEGPVKLTVKELKAQPESINCIQGYSSDPRTLDKLLNDVNQTTDDVNMWLIPFSRHSESFLEITLPEKQEIRSLKFWNYNKSPEDTFRGIRLVRVLVDGQVLIPELALRKAPGHALVDFSQEVNLPSSGLKKVFHSETVSSPSPYPTPASPQGFSVTLKLFSTWGDPHYIGLNGVNFYDHEGKIIQGCRVLAFPSLQSLEAQDPRVAQNLVDGDNDSASDLHSWLAPFIDTTLIGFANKAPNVLQFFFDNCEIFGAIQIWNYRKNPERGVRMMDVLVDDALVFKGAVRSFDGDVDWSSWVVFNQIAGFEGRKFLFDEPIEVIMFNEKRNLNGFERRKGFSARPKTGI
jgi:hypothetical protein